MHGQSQQVIVCIQLYEQRPQHRVAREIELQIRRFVAPRAARSIRCGFGRSLKSRLRQRDRPWRRDDLTGCLRGSGRSFARWRAARRPLPSAFSSAAVRALRGFDTRCIDCRQSSFHRARPETTSCAGLTRAVDRRSWRRDDRIARTSPMLATTVDCFGQPRDRRMLEKSQQRNAGTPDSRIRAITSAASIESPPSIRKSSSTPTRSTRTSGARFRRAFAPSASAATYFALDGFGVRTRVAALSRPSCAARSMRWTFPVGPSEFDRESRSAAAPCSRRPGPRRDFLIRAR